MQDRTGQVLSISGPALSRSIMDKFLHWLFLGATVATAVAGSLVSFGVAPAIMGVAAGVAGTVAGVAGKLSQSPLQAK